MADALMRLAMDVRAWSEARPAYEAAREKDYLMTEMGNIETRQQEQGTSSFFALGAPASPSHFDMPTKLIPRSLESIRHRLVGFVASVKSALSDLQG
jgi:hypothetical protein